MLFLFGSSLLASVVTGQYVNLVTFDGAQGTTFTWTKTNDPVMGGQSYSNFTINKDTQELDWSGTVRTVPSLDAPGFCEIYTAGLQKFNDASDYTHLGISLKNTIQYNGWKICFGANTFDPQFECFKADFSVTASDDYQQIYLPWNAFSNDWSAYTGEPVTTCSDNPKVCPTSADLAVINQISIWAEGVNGEFDANIQWVRAANVSSAKQYIK